MSAKSTKTKKLSVPRPMEDIQKAYQQLCANLGQTEYQIYVYNREVEKIKGLLESTNREAAARQQLDMEAKKTQTETQAV